MYNSKFVFECFFFLNKFFKKGYKKKRLGKVLIFFFLVYMQQNPLKIE